MLTRHINEYSIPISVFKVGRNNGDYFSNSIISYLSLNYYKMFSDTGYKHRTH